MKRIESEITQYWIHFQAQHSASKRQYPTALIKCYHDDDYVLQLTFYPDGSKLPANHYDKRNKLVYLRYPMAMYRHTMDILRNEKPVFFEYSRELNQGFLRTGLEPVGEGEYDADFKVD
jgi:hypothetical protein